MKRHRYFLLTLLLSAIPSATFAESAIVLHDDFNSLEQWTPMFFPKVKLHSEYTVEPDPALDTHGKNFVLRLASKNSASALMSKVEFDPVRFPVIRWRWRTDTVFSALNPGEKRGDDYPVRVYVMFDTALRGLSLIIGDSRARVIVNDCVRFS